MGLHPFTPTWVPGTLRLHGLQHSRGHAGWVLAWPESCHVTGQLCQKGLTFYTSFLIYV